MKQAIIDIQENLLSFSEIEKKLASDFESRDSQEYLINLPLGVLLNSDLKSASQLVKLLRNKPQIQIKTKIPPSQAYLDFFAIGGNEERFWQVLSVFLEGHEQLTWNLDYELDLISIYNFSFNLEKILDLNGRFKRSGFSDHNRVLPICINFVEKTQAPWMLLKEGTEEVLGQLQILKDFLSQRLSSERAHLTGYQSSDVDHVEAIHHQSLNGISLPEKRKLNINTCLALLKKEQEDGKSFLYSFPFLKDFWDYCAQFDPQITEKTLVATKNQLNKVSPTFCLAKWTTTTLHLESGTTHSCHHPPVHKIPTQKLDENFSSLHNTDYKIKQRKMMIQGKRPSECDYCWNIEDLKSNEVSDRIIKSAAPYSLNQFETIVKNPYSEKINPRYIEISFSNKCQFKCSYCSADYSSTWAEELNKFGNYQTMSGASTKEIIKEEDNKYVQTFWKWWPHLKDDIHTLRITGGEPLLSPSTFKVLESLVEEPIPNMSLSINTNLGAPPVLVDKFIDLCREVYEKKSVKTVEVFTSIDAFGPRAEYIRHGLKNEYFWQNLEKLLQSVPQMKVYIMCTFNALSITSFKDLLKKVMEVNLRQRHARRIFPLDIDFAYLRHPEYQTVKVLPSEYQGYLEDIVHYIEENHWLNSGSTEMGFLDHHVIKMKRIQEWMRQPVSDSFLHTQRSRFYQFFSEHDRRRQTNFVQTFPEMKEFWELCQRHHERGLI
ncbi:twitch domain-containing radical SAM protein [Pseudobdellovibrio exovorus]|uniref:Radical SAM core domain-containing protein n=1 Tax=Pseudobdellovibrio exovorus JSS TaxID=1184267 RepID=M4VB09_9BACT|nr:twitch domain-containing radical SAM protein [Pseudobdellovibrio exovorus]AGH96567.1 hypothetical protein A11Q_2351 [Pseudobdellovibrio exovorus JSS]